MLIPPRIIYYPLNTDCETNHWNYHEVKGEFGEIRVDYGEDKFNWNPTIEYRLKNLCTVQDFFDVPIFRYDSSRKNMKPNFKWTKRQAESFISGWDRPFDLIGYFSIHYKIDNQPIIMYNPWEKREWSK